jgi:DNA-binding NtrC family response regulator
MGLHQPLELAPGSLDQLMDYDWPGNVRELENMVERALIKCMDGRLVFENMAFPFQKDEISIKSDKNNGVQKLDDVMFMYIQKILKIANGKINGPGGAAELLGVHPNTLRKRMIKLGIPYGPRRSRKSKLLQ